MSPAASALLAFALVGVPVGLVSGMALGLPAYGGSRRTTPTPNGGRPDDATDSADATDPGAAYSSFRRRAARLGHIAAVALPLIAGFYAIVLLSVPHDAVWAARAAWCWIAAGTALPIALGLAAWRRRLALLCPAPATVLLVAAVLFAHAVLASVSPVVS